MGIKKNINRKASGRYGQEQKGYAYVYKLYGEDTQFILVSSPYSYECGHASSDDYHSKTCYGATYNYLGCPSGTKKYFTSNVDGKIYCLGVIEKGSASVKSRSFFWGILISII